MPAPWEQYQSTAMPAPPPTAESGPWSKFAAPPAERRDSAMDAISGFLSGAAGIVPAIGGAIAHPLNAMRDTWNASKDQYDKAVAAAGPAGDNKGNLAGFIQHAAGMFPVFGPMASNALDGIGKDDAREQARKLGEIVAMKAAPTLAGKIGEGIPPELGPAIIAGAKAAAPDVLAGASKTAGGAAVAHLMGPESAVIAGVPVYKGVAQMARGAKTGFEAAKAAWQEARGLTPAEGAEGVPVAAPLPASFVAGVPVRPPLAGAAAPEAVSPHPAAGSYAAAKAEFERVAAIRANAPPIVAAESAVPPAAAPAPAAALEAQGRAAFEADRQAADQKNADAGDAQSARQTMDAESIEWAARRAKADRFVKFLEREKLEPNAANVARATRELAERAAPSGDTLDLIHDRMGYDPLEAERAAKTRLAETLAPAKGAAAPVPGEAPSELEQQLRDSIAAQNARKAAKPSLGARLKDALLDETGSMPLRSATFGLAGRAPGLPASAWIRPSGAIEPLVGAETHGNALVRLGVARGKAFQPLESGWVRQGGDAIQTGDLRNPNNLAAFQEAARASKADPIVVSYPGGDVEIPVNMAETFFADPGKFVKLPGAASAPTALRARMAQAVAPGETAAEALRAKARAEFEQRRQRAGRSNTAMSLESAGEARD